MRIVLLLALFALSACGRWPSSYSVPAQYAEEKQVSNFMIDMNSPDAPAHFISDIGAELTGGSWRWTGQHPSLRLLITETGRLKYSADFALWDEAMRQTGPVTLTFLVNGKTLDRVRYDTPGARHFEKTVPDDWLSPAADTVFGAEIDKLYLAPRDGAKFGFILVRIGFLPE